MVRLNKSQCFGSGAGAGRRSSLTPKTGNRYSKTGWILAPKARASRAQKAAGKVGHLAILALPKGQAAVRKQPGSRCSESKSLAFSPPKMEGLVALTCLRSAVRMQKRVR